MPEIDKLIEEMESGNIPDDFVERLKNLNPEELLNKMDEVGIMHQSREEYERSKLFDEQSQKKESIRMEARQKKIEEIKEDLRITLDIVREMTREYKTIDSVAWPVTLMVLFNEVRNARKDFVWPAIGSTIGPDMDDPTP